MHPNLSTGVFLLTMNDETKAQTGTAEDGLPWASKNTKSPV